MPQLPVDLADVELLNDLVPVTVVVTALEAHQGNSAPVEQLGDVLQG